ncbi:MAG TPA: peptidyl-tRNA hydrolase [Acidothermaceae bacterium]
MSEYRDPPGEAPWAMPIVVRAEKGAEPTAAAVAEAAATAVVQLLEDRRSVDGEWHDEVQRWLDGRIRKVARRARGSKWDAAAALPGVTVVHHRASVRALVPGPTDAVPPEIAKLQVAGLDLEPGTPSAATTGVLAIAVTPHVTMSPLKAAVQVAHAAQLSLAVLAGLEDWRATGFGVRLIRPDADHWAQWSSSARVVVRDAGFTEVPPDTQTAIALWHG